MGKKMKRINLTIDSDLYEKARTVAFIKRRSISEIMRIALGEWIKKNMDKKSEIILSAKDEAKLLKILESDEFISEEKAKKILDL
jgi:Arc/MetJ-type ribon-helix-helix transcriptional regulator